MFYGNRRGSVCESCLYTRNRAEGYREKAVVHFRAPPARTKQESSVPSSLEETEHNVGVGFEPTVPFGTDDYESPALDRSAIRPTD